jgi:tetratricopeptide (TPR) repeat protein
METLDMKKNEYLLSLAEFKNILKQQNRDTLMELLIESYKAVPQLKEFITAKYADQNTMKQIFETYKNTVHNVFFPGNMRAQFKIGEARKAVNNFKKLCTDEKLAIGLMLYYVEMGVEFTNTYGDISESFYSSVESMYQAIIDSINKHKDPEIFNVLNKRLKAVVDDTSGIGWGFHDNIGDMYYDIKWLDITDIDMNENNLQELKKYISTRLKNRNNLPKFDAKLSIDGIIGNIVEADEIFLHKMDKQHKSYSDDEEYDYIFEKTGIDKELVELVLWQRCCFEMENDNWQFEGKCSKCGSTMLYIKEIPNEDFADRVVCKLCETEFIRT